MYDKDAPFSVNDLDVFGQIPAGAVFWSVVQIYLIQLILTVVPLYCELYKFSEFVSLVQDHFRYLWWFEQNVPQTLIFECLVPS